MMNSSEEPAMDDQSFFQLSPEHDGLTCTPYLEGLIVIGGPSLRRIWRFSFKSLQWQVLPTQGQYSPPGRLHHTSCLWRGAVVVAGGVSSDWEERLEVFKLDVATMKWSRVQAISNSWTEAFSSRSHHAAAVVDDSLFIHGGKPTYEGALTSDMRHLHATGFFDILVLDLLSGSWHRRIHAAEGEYVPMPPLWGHSLHATPDAIIFFGGFEVDLALVDGAESYDSPEAFALLLQQDVPVDTPPVAEMTNIVHIFGLHTDRLAAFAPAVMLPAPLPRALHIAHLIGSELIVMGGVTVDAGNACVVPVSDMWTWNLDSGFWRAVEPLPWGHVRSARALTAIYDSQLVVSHNLLCWHVLDISCPVEVRTADTEDPEVSFCVVTSVEDWKLIEAPAPESSSNPLFQSELMQLGGTLHPRRRRFLSTDTQQRYTPKEKVSHVSSPLSPNDRAELMKKFMPFSGRLDNSRRGAHINPVISAIISQNN